MKRHPDTQDRFAALASLARGASVPPLDIAAQVTQRVRAATVAAPVAEPALPRWAYALTGAFGVAGLCCAWVGWQAWAMVSDPLSGWLFSTIVS